MRKRSVACLAMIAVLVFAGVAVAQTAGENVNQGDGQIMMDTGKALMESGARMIDNGNMMKEQHRVEYGELVIGDGREMMELGERIIRHGEKMMMDQAGK